MRCFALTPMMGRSIASTSCGATPSLISTMAHPPLTAPGSRPKAFTSRLHQVAADEIAFKLMGSMHGHEAAGRGIDDDISRLRGRRDQTFDESDWLNVRMNSAVDLLWPAVGNPVITPGARVDWRLLQHDEIVTVSARALAHAGAQVVPGDEINGLKIGNAEMMTLTKTVGIDPAHQIPAGRKHSHELDANRINIFFGHRR